MSHTAVKPGKVPLTHQAQDRIRQYIVDQGLASGDPLPPEGKFCEMLGMSKATVREAIRSLEFLGVVEVRHGRGLVVGSFTLAPMLDALPYQLRMDDTPLREILQVRAAIEEGLIVEASKALSDEELTALDALVEQMSAVSTQGEVPPEVDRAFHLALFAPLGNALLTDLIRTFWEIYARSAATLETPINHHAVESHAEILAAIRSGDRARMRRAVEVHFAPIQSASEIRQSPNSNDDCSATEGQ